MIALSPRAVARLESYTPSWPIPKIFRLTKNNKLIADIFAGATINTPSMIAVEDQLDALNWAKQIGGLDALISRSQANLKVVEAWVKNTDWADFLSEREDTRSSTSICLKITDPWFNEQTSDDQSKTIKRLTKLLAEEAVAFDIAGYRDAPAGLRIWGGATVESSDIAALMPWIDWAYAKVKAE
jgi:phosphoserine aminotransferase